MRDFDKVEPSEGEAFLAEILERGADEIKFLVFKNEKAVVKMLAVTDRERRILRINVCDFQS